MKKTFATLFLFIIFIVTKAQTNENFADSIRITYKIPELAYAVVSANQVFESQTLGYKRANTDFKAEQNDRFHIGSNTKAITSFLAALLVKKGKINWDTKFLDLFPKLKPNSKKVFQAITLENLLTFRGKLTPYTYTFNEPTKEQITGKDAHQRFLLAKYFLQQKPMKEQNGLTPSNADYILAGLMLEKASGKSYKELVTDFGKTLKINFRFDYPNLSDTSQPWGHDIELKPIPPFDNYKLNWLLSAGNINVSLIDYIKYIQLQLQGLKGNSNILSKDTFNKLLFGLPTFSFGWFNKTETDTNYHIAYNEGNAGAFITQVQIIKEADRGYIIFTNSATTETSQGIAILLNYLKSKYSK